MIDKIKLDMIEYFGDDIKQVTHALKVYGFAGTISGVENLPYEKRMVTELAAVLHDIGIEEAERKHGSRAGRFQEIEGPPIARDILRRNGIPDDIIERVCFIIGHHHTYEKIDDIDFRIVVESDFIVNIFEGNVQLNEAGEIKKKYFRPTPAQRILESMYLRP